MAMGESMPPQAPGQAQGAPLQGGGQGASGGASQLVVDIQDKMAQLADLLGQSQALNPQDKQEFTQIMGAYQSFVENTLGSAPGAQKPEPPGPKGPVPMEAGGAKTMPAM